MFSLIWRQFKTDEIPLVVAAYRTYLGGLRPLEDKTTVQAHPLLFHIRHKELALLEKLRVSSEPVPMNLLNLCYLEKRSRYLVKAFLLAVSPKDL